MGLEYSFTRYLSAKKSVDDRALNRPVWQALQAAIAARTRLEAAPLAVLEVGAGIGSMVQRAVEWGLLGSAHYVAIDAEPENLGEAAASLPRWAREQGFEVIDQAASWRFRRGRRSGEQPVDLQLRLERADLYEFLARPAEQHRYDLLIAHAVLDLLDLSRGLPLLLAAMRPGGLLYLTINFDGATILQPEIEPVLDAKIERLYHQTMDTRLTDGLPSGDSHTGRHLFGRLRNSGVEILAAGASDWVVFAGRDGYAHDEAYFLHFIVDTMRGALSGHPDLDARRFAAWIAQRHAQIERGELVYIAHQVDFLARNRAPL